MVQKDNKAMNNFPTNIFYHNNLVDIIFSISDFWQYMPRIILIINPISTMSTSTDKIMHGLKYNFLLFINQCAVKCFQKDVVA